MQSTPSSANAGTIHTLRGNPCQCANPNEDCYQRHYRAECCTCGCGEGCDCAKGCECEWILLAQVTNDSNTETPHWTADHSVRRLSRPVLMADQAGIVDPSTQQSSQQVASGSC